MYLLVWEFRVRAGAEEPFERLYGPAGEWVALFRRAPGYVGTELLRDDAEPRRYLTIDRWESRELYAAFRRGNESAYRTLDREGDALTEHERLLGELTPVVP